MAFRPTPHAILDVPTAAEAAAMGEQAWIKLMNRREEIIRAEKRDPYRCGWEPPVWQLCDCLLGFPWVDKTLADQVRAACGFKHRLKTLLILGGNRGGKSEYASKRSMRILNEIDGATGWAFHSSSAMSREYQQPLFWKYMPVEYKRTVKGVVEYIAYKEKTGFSDDCFVLPNHSRGVFKNYEQDMSAAVEGGDINIFWADELAPSDWVETLQLRLATREGWGLVTFTPVAGYSGTVRMFVDAADIVMHQTAYLVPKDGKGIDLPRALGFKDDKDMERAHAHGRWSVPEDIVSLLLAEGGMQGIGIGTEAGESDRSSWVPAGQAGRGPDGRGGRGPDGRGGRGPDGQAGRMFETVPRILRSVDENLGVVYFHTRDNPFGNPKSVAETLASKPSAFVKERFYGVATKLTANRFPKFNTKIHVVPAKSIPTDGTLVHFADPAKGRNFFMKWYQITRDAVYLVREWPGYYEIPGHGVLGAWALPDGKKKDGRMGPAQDPLGWGLLRYKAEIARLEGWKDYRRMLPQEEALKKREAMEKEAKRKGEPAPAWDERSLKALAVERWDPRHGAREVVAERWIDSRAASEPRVENDRPKTLQTDFEDIGLYFRLTPGDDIDEGVMEINSALDWNEEMPLDYFNRPSFYVSDECRNSIFALRTWTNDDGNKGACKDPIDLDRYLFMSDALFWRNSHGPTRTDTDGRRKRGVGIKGGHY